MTKKYTSAVVAALVSTAFWMTSASAQDLSGGKEVDPAEASRALPTADDFQFQKAAPIPNLAIQGATRDLQLDSAAVLRSMTAVGKTADGKTVEIAPSDEVKKALDGDGPKAERAGPGKDSADPATLSEDQSRQVFGADERVQITNTKVYPYSVIGYLESKNKKGEFMMCTGTLIGPRTVLTAAHCVYDHKQEGGFSDDFLFVPGLAGPEDAPFGAYKYESVYVYQGYIDNYKGQYDGNIIPYDLAIVTLKDPIGDALGWLGYYAYPELGDFEANIAGYQGDKPQFTMWRSRCNVLTERVYADVFSYDCDVYQGSSGSAVYAYDTGAKQRVIVGVNVASGPEIMNQAVRLNAANVAWINSLNK